jgi:hypothetical protein|tara:strand:- start:1198 stop:1428 length:231 start_codon:yes stop_codon:yes gene_type:complete
MGSTSKPLRFEFQNEELILRVLADTKTVHQQHLDAIRRQTEVQHEMLTIMVDMASALIHLANKFPEINEDDIARHG